MNLKIGEMMFFYSPSRKKSGVGKGLMFFCCGEKVTFDQVNWHLKGTQRMKSYPVIGIIRSRSLLNNQYFMESKGPRVFFFVAQVVVSKLFWTCSLQTFGKCFNLTDLFMLFKHLKEKSSPTQLWSL